jgi:hypothetical protein
MEWAIDVRRTHVDPDCREFVEAMALFTRNLVEEVEKTPGRIRQIVQGTHGSEGGGAIVFRFSIYNLETYERAIEALRRRRSDLPL